MSNRTAAKAQAFAHEHGVAAPATLAELAQQCDVIALCVSADADVLGAVREIAAAARPGTIVVDHSTVAPDTAKQAHALMRAAGGDFLDAPVSGGVEGAKNGKLGGGPQMVEVSRDGKRVYFTNSLYGAIDPQFYEGGFDGWMVKLDAKPEGGIAFDEKFFVAWPKGQLPHQVRLQGGDCSSDSYCYP